MYMLHWGIITVYVRAVGKTWPGLYQNCDEDALFECKLSELDAFDYAAVVLLSVLLAARRAAIAGLAATKFVWGETATRAAICAANSAGCINCRKCSGDSPRVSESKTPGDAAIV